MDYGSGGRTESGLTGTNEYEAFFEGDGNVLELDSNEGYIKY